MNKRIIGLSRIFAVLGVMTSTLAIIFNEYKWIPDFIKNPIICGLSSIVFFITIWMGYKCSRLKWMETISTGKCIWSDIEHIIVGHKWLRWIGGNRKLAKRCNNKHYRLEEIINHINTSRSINFKNKYLIFAYLSDSDENVWSEGFKDDLIQESRKMFSNIFNESDDWLHKKRKNDFYHKFYTNILRSYNLYLEAVGKLHEATRWEHEVYGEFLAAISRIKLFIEDESVNNKEPIADIMSTILSCMSEFRRFVVPNRNITEIMCQFIHIMKETKDIALIPYISGYIKYLGRHLNADEFTCFLLSLWRLFESRWHYSEKRFYRYGDHLQVIICELTCFYEHIEKLLKARSEEKLHRIESQSFIPLREDIGLFLRLNRDDLVKVKADDETGDKYKKFYSDCCGICSLLRGDNRMGIRVANRQTIRIDICGKKIEGESDVISSRGISFFTDGSLGDFLKDSIVEIDFPEWHTIPEWKRKVRVKNSRYWSMEKNKKVYVNAIFDKDFILTENIIDSYELSGCHRV